MPAKIIKAATIADLETKLDGAMAANWLPQGGPFVHPESRQFCQLVIGPAQPAGTVQLREPAKARK